MQNMYLVHPSHTFRHSSQKYDLPCFLESLDFAFLQVHEGLLLHNEEIQMSSKPSFNPTLRGELRSMYVLHVCIACMYCMYVLYVCICMYVLYACIVCMYACIVCSRGGTSNSGRDAY